MNHSHVVRYAYPMSGLSEASGLFLFGAGASPLLKDLLFDAMVRDGGVGCEQELYQSNNRLSLNCIVEKKTDS